MNDRQASFRNAVGSAVSELGCSFVGCRQEEDRDVLSYRIEGGDMNEIKTVATDAGARSVDLCGDGVFRINLYHVDAPE